MKKNFIDKLYPTTKFLGAVALILSAFIIPGYVYSYSILIICAVIALLAGKLGEFIKITAKSLFVLVIIIFIMQSIFLPGGEVWFKLGFISVYRDGVTQALKLTSKIVAFGSAFIMFFRITSIKDFITSLEKLGMHPKAAYVVMSTLQIIPEMKKEAGIIMDAQKTRGVETEGNVLVRAKAFIPTFGPLILSSIAKTEERAITLESRAFSSGMKKTRLHDIEKTKHDNIIRLFILVFLILCIVWRVLAWRI